MKVSCTKDNLAKALGAVSRLVGSTTALPVLSNVLVATDGNRLKLSTTNLEVGINYWIGAKVAQAGAITVPARLFTDFVANLPSETVELALEKSSLKVSTKKYRSTLNGVPADEFPSIPTIQKATPISIPVDEFKTAVSQVVLVASGDDTRPVLNGVYVYSEGGNLVLVATDSYRLAEKTIPLSSASKQPVGVIVPARTLQEVLRVISEDEQPLELLINDNQVLFRSANFELISRLIDGQFPNYRELIPKDTPSAIVIDTSEFANLAKVASLFAASNAGSVTVEIDSKRKALRLHSVASQMGENTSEAPGKVTGEDAETSLNSRYLSDALSVIPSAQVNFAITGKVNPCVLRPTTDKSYLHIIMPLRS